MSRVPPLIDELTLASYIAGTLPAQRRQKVTLLLTQNVHARELLQMAYEAIDAVAKPSLLTSLEEEAALER